MKTEAEQLSWLVDRAEITDLLVRFAQAADDKDFAGLADCFAPEGVIVAPFRGSDIKQDEIAAAVEEILEPYEATLHFVGSYAIQIDGDRATARHKVIAIHVPSTSELSSHAEIGGIYSTSLRRLADGWRLTSLDLRLTFTDGLPFTPGGPTA
jgi:uncharacterized protein (TIGR02246 family)